MLSKAHLTQLRNSLDCNIIQVTIELVLNEELSPVRQQCFVTHLYTLLRETEKKPQQFSRDQHVNMLFYILLTVHHVMILVKLPT